MNYFAFLVLIFFSSTCIVGDPNVSSSVKTLAGDLRAAANYSTVEKVKEWLNSAQDSPPSAEFLAQAYAALREDEANGATHATKINNPDNSMKEPSTETAANVGNDTNDQSEPSDSNQITEDSVAEGMQDESEREDLQVVDRKRFEQLALQMKKNSDDLVSSLRTNAAIVVRDFIQIAQKLENQIRAKSEALLQSVHLSAEELKIDNEKLASTIDKFETKPDQI